MAIIKDVTVKINNGTATLDAPVQFYEKDHDVELRFRLMDYKYKYDKDPQNILNSVDEDILEAYTTIVNPKGYELEQINGVVKNDIVIFRLDPTYTDELDELGTYKLQIHIKCTHSEFTIPPITFEVLQRLKGIKVVTDGEDEVDNSEILDNSSKFVSDETGKLIIEWKKGDMISSAKLNAMVDVINDAVDEEKIRQENEIERKKKANNKIQELENTRVEYVNKFDDELDSFAYQVDTTMSDYETRFNALTVSQQQDAEVIDARDGEQTLRARLDRDMQKPSIMYEEVEGSHINVDTTCGYTKNVEIIGNTIQNQNDLADIRSVGDKLENQELYKIPVLSTGKNLIKCIDHSISGGDRLYLKVNLNKNTDYIISSNNEGVFEYRVVLCGKQLDSQNKPVEIKQLNEQNKRTFNTESNFGELYILFHFGNAYEKYQNNNINIQIEKGTQVTPYEPYQEDKITILSPVQLEKVENVTDRIVNKNGVWGVEKNIYMKVFDGSEDWVKNTSLSQDSDALFVFKDKELNHVGPHVDILSNRFLYHSRCSTLGNIGIRVNYESGLQIRIETNKLNSTSLDDFKNWLNNNNLCVKYPAVQPTFIPLPYDQQIALRTFANKTNISFQCEIEPTIKASVPKSLGATVNSHSEQIDNLNKELDRVKKLEESTVSTVTTESDFTTVENTSNGYFEDVKLEGRTLVNLFESYYKNSSFWSNNTYDTDEQGYIIANANGSFLALPRVKVDKINIKANTEYTVLVDIKNNSLNGNFHISYKDTTVFDKTIQLDAKSVGIYKYKLTSMADISNSSLVLRTQLYNNCTEGSIAYKIALIEGDHTQNTPSYFDGLKSVGDGVEEISVLTQNKEETKENEKRILYYNDETQTWEKPILRQWDSIEKHSDGKYYYHVRSEEIVLNGSENWILNDANNNGIISATCGVIGKVKGTAIADKLASSPGADTEGVLLGKTTGKIMVCLNITRLSTQDLAGFKAWLQANPTTVVYQLAQEEVYECTNLDLITYSDETNLLVKSGVLNPKVTLKVSNGVGNVVTMLQNKVTMLEQMVYNLMKMFDIQPSNIDE